MESIFNEKPYQEILTRIDALTEKSSASWGNMDVAQMCAHCKEPIEVALGKKKLDQKPSFLLKLLFKKSLYNDTPYRKNLPTAKQYKIVTSKDFEQEKNDLKSLIDEFHNHKTKEDWAPHPVFGTFTKEQWGKMTYKHLDHHLRQFNA
ncbi:DUF1569 domain-containing protein [Leptobacterium sp. I13]|uniref:DUF1569 domain-containing protein n=1 Tax=Leptobacterium meishanense TaxID=3128904 RepID=UPI0030EDB1CB